MQEVFWHTKSKEEIFSDLLTSDKGITRGQAEKRLQEQGLNEFTKQKSMSWFLIFLKQFHSPLIYVLFVAMVIAFVFAHLIDAYVILAVVLINSVIGFVEERKAEKAIDALGKMIVSYARVYRNGEILKIPARELVRGDIIFLEEGDKVPADARIIEEKNLRTQESSLTGESFPEDKELKILQKETSLGDRTNMVFMSTLVVSGNAKAVVVSTGDETEIGKVAESIKEVVQPKMHFQVKVSQLAVQMSIFAVIGAGLTFSIGFFFRDLEFFELLFFTIASLVSGIPEGLPAVLIVVLAIGARRMAKRNALIRHLPAVETLGVTTVIATDKTGTITQNSMAVEKIITSENEINITGNGWLPIGKFLLNNKPVNPLTFLPTKKLLYISTLCNKSTLLRKNGNYEMIGDPTESAMLVLSKKAGISREELEKNEKIIDDMAFSSELKYRATLIKQKEKNKKQIYVVGAFESILKNSAYILEKKQKSELNKNLKDKFLKKAEHLAKKGLRVLALAYRDVLITANSAGENLVTNLVFVGLVGMKDPPRQKVKLAIQKTKNAGIRVIMQTGDHHETALAIAKEVGLVSNSKTKNSKVLTGQDLEKMSDNEFNKAVREVNIFARVTPKMKLKIISALQAQGEIVAMTGDGVNDAPALKKADIGVSMGIIGTDVARESSEVILSDDNFSSIVNAVEEGRTVFRNVKRTSFFLVTTSVAEDVTIVSSLAIGMPLILLPTQLLYVNLVTDSLSGVSLAMEPSHSDVLNQKPRNKKEGILDKQVIPFLLLSVGFMVLGTLPLFFYYLQHGIDKARTVSFLALSMFQLWNMFNMRSIKRSIFDLGVFSNKWIIYAFLASIASMLVVLYIPFFQEIFNFVPLTLGELLLVFAVSASVLVAGEIYKRVKYKK